MNYGEIISSIRGITDEQIQTARLTTETIELYANSGYFEMCSDITALNVDYFGVVDSTVNLIANQKEYAFPDTDAGGYTRVEHLYKVQVAYDGTNFRNTKPLDVINVPDSDFEGSVFTTNAPKFMLVGNNFHLYPTPDSSQTNALKIWYAQRPAPMTEDSQVPQFSPAWHMGIVLRAAIHALRQELDPGLNSIIDRYQGDYNSIRQDMVEKIGNRQDTEPETVGGSGVRDDLGEFYVRPGSITII